MLSAAFGPLGRRRQCPIGPRTARAPGNDLLGEEALAPTVFTHI